MMMMMMIAYADIQRILYITEVATYY